MKSLHIRFWSKVDRKGDNECWLWKAYRLPKGYGRISKYGKDVGAHRLSWEIHFGEIPHGLCVCHECDTPSCVNPKHLFLGTQNDNIQDAKTKGRLKYDHLEKTRFRNLDQFGEKNPSAKLTWESVKKIRDEYSKGETTHRKLAAKFGVSPQTVGNVLIGQSWNKPPFK